MALNLVFCMEENRIQLSFIDGLKGVSACLIAFVWHYQHFLPIDAAPFRNVFFVCYHYGDHIVELFFMLSGFGMMLGYSQKIFSQSISFPQYIKKRIIKLYPLFLISTFIVYILQLFIHHRIGEYFVYKNYDVYHLVLNILLLQNGALETEWSFNSPSWVISVLMLLYCLFYFVCYIAKNDRKTYYFFAVFALIGGAIIIKGDAYPLINSLVGRGLSCFSIGVLLHLIFQKKICFNSKLFGVLGLILIISTYVLLRLDKQNYVGNTRLLMIFGISPMIIICSMCLPWISKILCFKPFVILGKISLAVYLLHFPIQCILIIINHYFIEINFGNRLIWILYAAITLLFSFLYTFLLQEKINKSFVKIVKYSRS